ncbi:ORF_050R [Scale drop disease virus]|nr:ORF_050R [Scale drop disease virus]AKU37465.1 ORF_050R [Scale drop disease virus]
MLRSIKAQFQLLQVQINPILDGIYDRVAKNFFEMHTYLEDNSLYSLTDEDVLHTELDSTSKGALISITANDNPHTLAKILVSGWRSYYLKYINNQFTIRNIKADTAVDALQQFLESRQLTLHKSFSLQRLAFRALPSTLEVPTPVYRKLGFGDDYM